MTDPFNTALREVIILREDFANSVTDAMDYAESPIELKKLLGVTVCWSIVRTIDLFIDSSIIVVFKTILGAIHQNLHGATSWHK